MTPQKTVIVFIALAAVALGACIFQMFFRTNKDDGFPPWFATALALNWLLTEIQRYELLNP